MNNNLLYLNSSNELIQSRNYQSQISQKEFEIRLIDINNKYAFSDNNTDFSNSMKRQNIELEIHNLKNHRDNHINNAIGYALDLALMEINNNISYSMFFQAKDGIRDMKVTDDITL